MSRKEWLRGLPWAFGVGKYDRKRVHWASERSVEYAFLIGDSVQDHPNPHQTGSKALFTRQSLPIVVLALLIPTANLTGLQELLEVAFSNSPLGT